jgi:hypothetical protein
MIQQENLRSRDSRTGVHRIVGALSALVAGVALATPAIAAEYALFGTYTVRQGFSVQRMIPALETYSATSAAPQPLVIPAHAFETTGSDFLAFPQAPSVAQFVETFTTTQPGPASFVGGGGPGSFSFCPRAGNPANPNCAVPASATGGRNGRIAYEAGTNEFGGTLDLLRITNGTVSRLVATAPLQYNHAPNFRSGLYIAGRPMSMTRTYPQNDPGEVTQSPVLGPDGSILTAGPVVGTAPAPVTQTATGFPFTTGKIIHSRTGVTPRTFTFTGSDARTPGGFGDISLVAGATAVSAVGSEFPTYGIIEVTVPEPATAPAVLAGVVMLLAMMWGDRRHRRLPSTSTC